MNNHYWTVILLTLAVCCSVHAENRLANHPATRLESGLSETARLPDDAKTPAPGARHRRGWKGGRLNVQATAWYLPYVVCWPDDDKSEDGHYETLFDHDLKHGDGRGMQLSFGNDGEPHVGLSYFTSDHYDYETDQDVDMHCLFVDLFGICKDKFEDYSPLVLNITIGGGVGAMYFNFEDDDDNTGGAAFYLRSGVELALHDTISLGTTLSYLHWGYPGETVGEGFMLAVSLSIRF